ncbi:C40 family peptidase [Streptomyces sp. NPDC059104]|uniref:C40 family peptidase n=1 Tax=Streptomyces sp. NPDC059104 TaxID=3346729 RepID=UPI0036C9C406
MNLGIATGILGTVVAPLPAEAAEHRRESGNTRELPAVPDALADPLAMADLLHGDAHRFALEAEEERAWAAAAPQARSDKTAAQRAADEAARKKAEEKRAANRKKAPPGGLAGVAGFARGKVGSAYVYGASSGGAFDCSGLVQAAYRANGISVPRTSQQQSGAYAEVRGELKPGDILYWGAKGRAYHVALYVGGGKFVGAQNPAAGVVLANLKGSGYSGAVRPG